MAVKVVPMPVTLSWSNFRSVDSSPDLSNDEVAQVHPEVSMPGNIATVPSPGKTGAPYTLNSFTLTVGLVQADTIVLSSATQTPELLNHEQGHYNLLILNARALARDLTSATDSTSSGLVAKVQALRLLHAGRATATDKAYDTQTDHGKDTGQQTAWNLAISGAMGNPGAKDVKGFPL